MAAAWFIAIAALWCLYLVLEGFDFGVGMLLRRVRGDQFDRRVALHTIGPTWAANEVWLVVAVVAMFGAFPGWYAAWSATFYLPLAVVLLALIARNAAIELLGKRPDETWRRGWERVLCVASWVAPFCWGLIWTAALEGVALRGEEAVGGPLDVLTPISVLGGLTLVALCRALGAAFLALRADGEVAFRAARELRRTAPAVALLVTTTLVLVAPVPALGAAAVLAALAFAALAATVSLPADPPRDDAPSPRPAAPSPPLPRAAALPRAAGSPPPAARAAALSPPSHSAARGFAAGCLAIALLVAVWFGSLWPAGLNGRGGGPALTLADVAAGNYTLTLMTILAGLLLPLLLALQAWSYWLFRERVTRAAVGAPRPSPIDVIARVAEKRGW